MYKYRCLIELFNPFEIKLPILSLNIQYMRNLSNHRLLAKNGMWMKQNVLHSHQWNKILLSEYFKNFSKPRTKAKLF